MELWGREVTDADLAHLTGLPALRSLYLDYTQVTDAGLVQLTELPALEHLYLDYERMSDEVIDASIAKLQQALPNRTISRQEPDERY